MDHMSYILCLDTVYNYHTHSKNDLENTNKNFSTKDIGNIHT